MKRIQLTKGKFALVDDEDFERLNRFKWYAEEKDNGDFYAVYKPCRTNVSMHRLLMRAPKGLVVDHVNGNGLDNRKSNLRICTYSQNGMHRRGIPSHSRSKVLGVSWCKDKKKWRAVIQVKGKQKFLGRFDDLQEAKDARVVAEKEFYKDYSPIR